MEHTINTKKKKRNSYTDRITLNQKSLEKIDTWLKQINEQFKSIIKVNKSDIINQIIKDYPEKLSTKDLKGIKENNFDDIKFAQWVMSELKKQKKAGESVSYDEIVKSVRPALEIQSSTRKGKKRNSSKLPKSVSLDLD